MPSTFPYTYISCPCSDPSRRARPNYKGIRDSGSFQHQEEDDDEQKFDPQNTRSNYSLYPPEHLLYCEECHDIKCPRCITEEIVCWYCPSCLFETPSSMVRSEGNRCARNCFNCPICTASLAVQAIGDGAVKDGPWILNCGYCMWTSLDIGIKFDKPTNIRAQLDKHLNGGKGRPENSDPSRKSSLVHETIPENSPTESHLNNAATDVASRFAAMRSFHKAQLAASIGSDASSGDYNYASPSALTRIMSLYTSSGTAPTHRKPKTRPPVMREALTSAEGLVIGYLPSQSKDQEPSHETLSPPTDFMSTPTPAQLLAQYPISANGSPHSRCTSGLRPLPTLLRTKRSKRCKSCKHILVKPEFKPTSNRFRIRLIALAYIPLISLRPLNPPTTISHPLLPETPKLQPGKTEQFILRLTNHLFEPVKVSLGVPGMTPGRYSHKITVLCPQFDIGPNSDVWDDALAGGSASASGTGGSILASTGLSSSAVMGGVGSGTMEAGKVFERGRNWVGVGIEIICSPVTNATRIKQPLPSKAGAEDADADNSSDEDDIEDPDLLEIPIRVRLEWRQSEDDPTGPSNKDGSSGPSPRKKSLTSALLSGSGGQGTGAGGTGGGAEDDPSRRELAYWMVVGVGRVAKV